MDDGKPKELTLKDLEHAVAGTAAAFRCRARLQPAGGDGDKVFPPTYAGGVYAVEDRRIEGRVVRCVLLDSVQSQANRMEEVLQEAFLPTWRELPQDGEAPPCGLPVIAVCVPNHGWITSLTAPHRVHDAILRDSEIDEESNGERRKVRFRDSQIGRAVVAARLHDATSFYRYCPTALLFGTWDSTAGEGLDSAKVPRAVVSEIIGVDITGGVRTASRIDPLAIEAASATVYRRAGESRDWTLNEAEAARDDRGNAIRFGAGSRAGRPSAINHGNITPDMPRFEREEVRDQKLSQLADILQSAPLKLRFDVESGDGRLRSQTELDGERVRIREGAVKPGGVTIAYALHTWTLSLAQLRRLRFPSAGNHDNNRNNAVRTALAAMGLYALALQRERGYWLRSRCELVPGASTSSVVFESVNVEGATTPFEPPNATKARQLLDKALSEVPEAIRWEARVIRLTPMEKLVQLVRASDAMQPDQEADVGPADMAEAAELEGTDASDQS
jgi:CRISPR-associated protein Csb1